MANDMRGIPFGKRWHPVISWRQILRNTRRSFNFIKKISRESSRFGLDLVDQDNNNGLAAFGAFILCRRLEVIKMPTNMHDVLSNILTLQITPLQKELASKIILFTHSKSMWVIWRWLYWTIKCGTMLLSFVKLVLSLILSFSNAPFHKFSKIYEFIFAWARITNVIIQRITCSTNYNNLVKFGTMCNLYWINFNYIYIYIFIK